MPFWEAGCQDLLDKSEIRETDSVKTLSEVESIIITVGTPLNQHIESDLSSVRAVIRDLLKVLRPEQLLVLRSTVAPETTAYLKKFLELNSNLKVGKDIGLAFCPERLAENKALAELETLPQIIGTEDDLSREKAEALFSKFGLKIFHSNYV